MKMNFQVQWYYTVSNHNKSKKSCKVVGSVSFLFVSELGFYKPISAALCCYYRWAGNRWISLGAYITEFKGDRWNCIQVQSL